MAVDFGIFARGKSKLILIITAGLIEAPHKYLGWYRCDDF
jgi:hypothetical protein